MRLQKITPSNSSKIEVKSTSNYSLKYPEDFQSLFHPKYHCIADNAKITDSPEERRYFQVPLLSALKQRWINTLPQKLRLIAQCSTYHSEHINDWMEGVDQQLTTGDNSKLIEFINKSANFIEKRFKREGYTDFKPFNEYLIGEQQKLLEKRYKLDEGHCVHDSLYNVLTADTPTNGFNRAAILVRDGQGPNYLQAYMVEEEGDTGDTYDADSEFSKPLNQRILGRGMYHHGLEDSLVIVDKGSRWHTLFDGVFDETLPIGIIPGFGDDSELRHASPRAVLAVQNHGTDLDTEVMQGLKKHANYVAERIKPSSSDYLLTPKS